MSTQHSLQADLLGLLPHRPPVNTQHLTQVLPQRAQVPLVPSIITGTLVVDKFITIFINTVVGQVDEVVGDLLWTVRVFFSGKPDQTLFIDIQLDRVNTGQENIQAQVKFQTSNQKRVVYIFLHNHLALFRWNVLYSVDQFDSNSTKPIWRFHYHRLP